MVIFCEIDCFACGCAVVVEFQEAAFVLDEAVGGRAEGAGTGCVRNGGAFGFGSGVFE